MATSRKQVYLDPNMAAFVESESSRRQVAESEVIKDLMRAGLSKSEKVNGNGNIFDALQIFKSDLLADLKRAIPAPVAPPTPNVVTPNIDFTDVKNEIISEVRRAVVALDLTAQSVPQTSNQSPKSDEILAKATKSIEAQNQLSMKLVGAMNSLTKITQTTRDVAVELSGRPSPTPGINRDEFSELVAMIKDEVAANRRFQQVTSDLIGQTMSEMQKTLREITAKSGDESHVANLAAQIKAFESRAVSLFDYVCENLFFARQYAGESMERLVDQRQLETLFKETKELWEEEREGLNAVLRK